MKAKICLVCEQTQSEGIAILEQLICRRCEQEMIHCDVEDECYQFYINQLKKLYLKEKV